jgi:hypothetical protein
LDTQVADPPSSASGLITFGNFNNLAKTSVSAMRVFGRILGRLSTAKFIIKGSPQGGGLSQGFFDKYLGNTRIYGIRAQMQARTTTSVSWETTTDGWTQ